MIDRPQQQVILPANGKHTAAKLMHHRLYREGLTAILKGLRALSKDEAVDLAIRFRRAHGLPCPDCDKDYYYVGLHRAALRWPELTVEEQNWSAHFLIREGYSTEVDEVFAPKPEAEPQKE